MFLFIQFSNMLKLQTRLQYQMTLKLYIKENVVSSEGWSSATGEINLYKLYINKLLGTMFGSVTDVITQDERLPVVGSPFYISE